MVQLDPEIESKANSTLGVTTTPAANTNTNYWDARTKTPDPVAATLRGIAKSVYKKKKVSIFAHCLTSRNVIEMHKDSERKKHKKGRIHRNARSKTKTALVGIGFLWLNILMKNTCSCVH